MAGKKPKAVVKDKKPKMPKVDWKSIPGKFTDPALPVVYRSVKNRELPFNQELFEEVCRRVSVSVFGVAKICDEDPNLPSQEAFSKWILQNEEARSRYALAKSAQADYIFDNVNQIAAETTAETSFHKKDANGNYEYDAVGNPVLVKYSVCLSPEVIAHKRLRVDALKWTAGKLKPKLYGDKTVQEHQGPNGGAIPVAAVNWKGLSESDLEAMQRIAEKSIEGEST